MLNPAKEIPVYRQKNNRLVTSYRQKTKDRAIAHKGGKCEICGYDRCVQALTFHHRDPKTKSFGIMDGRTRSWETIRSEIGKCALLCQNCHSEVHAGLVSLPSAAPVGFEPTYP